jgi:hypothetical protein
MRGPQIIAGIATLGLLAVSGAAGAQGFGQVTFGTAPSAAPATGSTDPAKPAGTNLDGVTVTGKRIPDSQKDPQEVLCHDELPIGSRFPKKVCATRSSFQERRREDQEMLRQWVALRPYKGN